MGARQRKWVPRHPPVTTMLAFTARAYYSVPECSPQVFGHFHKPSVGISPSLIREEKMHKIHDKRMADIFRLEYFVEEKNFVKTEHGHYIKKQIY